MDDGSAVGLLDREGLLGAERPALRAVVHGHRPGLGGVAVDRLQRLHAVVDHAELDASCAVPVAQLLGDDPGERVRRCGAQRLLQGGESVHERSWFCAGLTMTPLVLGSHGFSRSGRVPRKNLSQTHADRSGRVPPRGGCRPAGGPRVRSAGAGRQAAGCGDEFALRARSVLPGTPGRRARRTAPGGGSVVETSGNGTAAAQRRGRRSCCGGPSAMRWAPRSR